MKKLLIAAALVTLTLSGCSLFHRKDDAWKNAQQERPLEVPPPLDLPPSAAAMTIPDAGTTPAGTTPGGAVSTMPEAAGSAAASSSLSLNDTVDNTYRRVGLALERGGVGTVTAHDDAAHTYSVAVQMQVAEPPPQGFFKRLFSVFSRARTHTVSGTVNVAVQAQGESASVIELTGEPAAVQQVLALLRSRLT